MKANFYSLVLGVFLPISLSAASMDGSYLTNGGFEKGSDRPAGWSCGDPGAVWAGVGFEGKHSLAVTGSGTNTFSWRSETLHLKAGGLYSLRYQSRCENGTSGGCTISGLSRVNRDFHCDESWRPYGFVFMVSDDDAGDYVRFGQWEVKGTLYFDNARLACVQPLHARYRMGYLGEAESIRQDVYRFQPDYSWAGANYHRTLATNRCGFNSDRWTFQSGSELVYRHAISDVPFKSGRISLNLNYYTSGKLRVEASTDGLSWTSMAGFEQNRRTGTNDLPAALFPATNILVRLIAEGSGANFQMDRYDFEAPLAHPSAQFEGETSFLEVKNRSDVLSVSLTGRNPENRAPFIQLKYENRLKEPLKVAGAIRVDEAEWISKSGVEVPPEQALHDCIFIPPAAPGRHHLEVRISSLDGAVLFEGETEFQVSLLSEPRAGYWAGGNEEHQLWWCESGWKLGRQKQWPDPPTNKIAAPILVSAAKGEYEAAQLVLRSVGRSLSDELNSIRLAPFRDARGEEIAVSAEFNRVEYVNVTHPTDSTGMRGLYPDPLPPLKTPVRLVEGKDLPLWITFQVPQNAKAGEYQGMIELVMNNDVLKVPVRLRVFDFELPNETHLKTALGLGTSTINQFHHLFDPAQQEAVFEKYLANFAAHRISPYSFFEFAPIDIRFKGEGTNKHAQVDFEKFDRAAEKWMGKFSTFMLQLHGMGGGTFQSRSLGTLEGFQEGTPEHARLFQDYLSQIEKHLRERGWLDKAFTYWFDEPDPKDYQFVVDGMKRIKAAGPGIKRMLTEQPEPALMGHVDIWCGLTPEWTPEKVAARRAAGESVWWYICCAPKAPYVTEFIDHPAVELRLWPWQSWQYGVEGLLVWATTYWTSSSAFPAPKVQDPWEDPMSYVSGYDFGPGHIGYWGNGDGRFLYPPKDALKGGKPCLDAPVNSIRWENLRDGMEDYEYLWLLAQAVERCAKSGVKSELLQEARELLTVPPEISKDLTHFTTDPRPVLARRERIARMIEKLKQ